MSETTEKKVADALAAQEHAMWKASVNQQLKAHEDRFDAVEDSLKLIAIHLAKIDTNIDWFIKVLKYVVGPVTAIYGGYQQFGG